MKLKSRLFASAVALTMVLSVAVPASAQTTAELTAQINSLLAMIAQLQAQLAAQGGSTSAGTVVFTKDLTVGSTGSEVTALQQFLVSKGFLTMPAGVAMGYFGTLTKNALAAYQTSAGISPAAGYFGPITRAKVNASGTTTGGTTTGGTTTGGTGITTPGAEGTLTVSSNNSGLVATVYEGDDMVPVYAFNVEAKNSDIAVQRVKLSLGSDSKVYTKGYSKMYVTEGGNVLASSDLNSSTVVKESSTYYITITGFNLIVPKGTKKQVVVKADVMPSIDSADRTILSGTPAGVAFTLPASGVRGVDGAGIDQYGPTTALTGRTPTVSASLAETATLKMSLNTSSPKKSQVVATAGSSENQYDKLPLLVFDLKAEKDAVKVTDINIEVAKAGSGGANASTTVYLFEGSTELDNATIVGNRAVFSDFDYVVPKDTTKTLTVKADIASADGTVATFTAAASTTGVAIVSENTLGDSVTESGSATGYAINVVNVGPEVTLVSKSVTTDGVAQTNGSPVSTSTLTATFNIKVKAVGGDLTFGTTASGSPMFASSTTSFKVYKNGAYDATISSQATSTSYSTPSGVSTSGVTNSFTLSEGNEVTIPVTFQIVGRKADGAALTTGLYSVGFEGLQYTATGVTSAATAVSFMAGETDWRTADVSFP